MKIYRVRDLTHRPRWATSDDEKTFFGLSGDISLGQVKITNERIEVDSLLAPVEPPTIYGIGLNYRKHALEIGMPIPKKPVLFNKFNNNGVVCCNTTVSSTAPAATAILAFKLKGGLYLNFTR